MEGVIALLSITMILAVLLLTCPLLGCSSAEAEQSAVTEQPSRYEVVTEMVHSGPFYIDRMAIVTITDKETGQQWVVASSNNGIAMQPIGGAE